MFSYQYSQIPYPSIPAVSSSAPPHIVSYEIDSPEDVKPHVGGSGGRSSYENSRGEEVNHEDFVSGGTYFERSHRPYDTGYSFQHPLPLTSGHLPTPPSSGEDEKSLPLASYPSAAHRVKQDLSYSFSGPASPVRTPTHIPYGTASSVASSSRRKTRTAMTPVDWVKQEAVDVGPSRLAGDWIKEEPMESAPAFPQAGPSWAQGQVQIKEEKVFGPERPVQTLDKMDMNMAVTGTMAAEAGIHTPLATYAAQMVVWLWFGNMPRPQAPSPNYSSPDMLSEPQPSPIISSPNPFDLSEASSSGPLNPLQVQPSPEFHEYVSRMLQYTMVSHSVTLIALLYIYKLKASNPAIIAEAGSEQRPFVASLILSNKYLDDNTYTNKTWSDLAGLPLSEINNMEKEFIKGLDWNLSVQVQEYTHWRNLLDGFILARQREAAEFASLSQRGRPAMAPVTTSLWTPDYPLVNPPVFTSQPARARSASPQSFTPHIPQRPGYVFAPSPAGLSRKRSAVDAFSSEVPSGIYEQMRWPTRKVQYTQAPQYSFPHSHPLRPVPVQRMPSSGLGRSSSLNRQIARIPSGAVEAGRRGSVGHVYSTSESADGLPPALGPMTGPSTGEIELISPMVAGLYSHPMSVRNTPPPQFFQSTPGGTPVYLPSGQSPYSGFSGYTEPIWTSAGDEWNGWSSLVAPYDGNAPNQVVPPEHLMFYSLAADAHPGQDGAPRKAILKYQDPIVPFGQQVVPSQQPMWTMQDPYGPRASVPTIPSQQIAYPSQSNSMPFSQPQVQIPYLGPPPMSASQTMPAYVNQPIGQELQLPPIQTTISHDQDGMMEYRPYPEPAQFANAGPPGYTYDPFRPNQQSRGMDGLSENGHMNQRQFYTSSASIGFPETNGIEAYHIVPNVSGTDANGMVMEGMDGGMMVDDQSQMESVDPFERDPRMRRLVATTGGYERSGWSTPADGYETWR